MSITSELETVLAELEEGGVEQEALDKVSALFAASPIRKERDDFRKKAELFEEDSKKYRGLILKTAFDRRGIKISPDALKLPEDLDPADDQAFDTWAVAAGLAEAPATTELDAAERIAGAVKGGDSPGSNVLTPEEVSSWPVDELLRLQKSNPDEYEALKRGEKVQITGFNRIVRTPEATTAGV